MMKTITDFLKNYSSSPDLHRRVWKAGNVNWSDFKANPNDFYAANTGAVTGMIYYVDTVKFAKRNAASIQEALNSFESDCGKLDVPRFSEDPIIYYNWLAWFAWENMAGELINYLEN